MRTTNNKCKINSLHVSEVTIKNLGPLTQLATKKSELGLANAPITAVMEAIYATTETDTKLQRVNTHGRCTANSTNWALPTIRLLAELLDSIERDLMPRHFDEGADLEDNNARFESGRDEEIEQV